MASPLQSHEDRNASALAPSLGGYVQKLLTLTVLTFTALLLPHTVFAQQNVPPAVQRTEAEIESAARRFGAGVHGGIGLDPEIINFGAHATFGPLFRNLQFRPGVELGLGELTTAFGINLDVLYTLQGSAGDRWRPYVGAGPNFSLSHRGFETEDVDNVDIDGDGVEDDDDEPSRFDFGDTDFNGGMNFIVGMRRPNGMFFEMNATAWGVSNVRLLAGFDF
jgi:hypothetical protein